MHQGSSGELALALVGDSELWNILTGARDHSDERRLTSQRRVSKGREGYQQSTRLSGKCS